MATVRPTFYLHDNGWDDDQENALTALTEAGMTPEQAQGFVDSNRPLYEVSITLEIDTETSAYRIVDARTQGETS